MSVLFLLIPLSVLLAVIAVFVFYQALRSGQYEHLEEKKWKILTDHITNTSESKLTRK